MARCGTDWQAAAAAAAAALNELSQLLTCAITYKK